MKKTYEEIVTEARTRTMRLNAVIEGHPDYAKNAAEVREGYAIACEMERVRKAAKLTQKEVASRMGVSQANVSRLSSGCVTLRTLRRYFDACGFELVVKAEPQVEDRI
ncbi:MAG: helix-turn-helix transcriptional regulator [Kiritimatiellia bacterium]